MGVEQLIDTLVLRSQLLLQVLPECLELVLVDVLEVEVEGTHEVAVHHTVEQGRIGQYFRHVPEALLVDGETGEDEFVYFFEAGGVV